MFKSHSVELDWGGRPLKLETGKIARQADGAVIATSFPTFTGLFDGLGAKISANTSEAA